MNIPLNSGVFLLDKPAGITSFAALDGLKKKIGIKKIGHTGTLDPFATGLLVVMSGKMTRMASMVTELDKRYIAVFKFGEETDTLDSTGRVIFQSPVPEYPVILAAIQQFTGTITQIPPVFSAVKINGNRSYVHARRGQSVDLPPRDVCIYSFEIANWESPFLEVEIRCSKGTYIRSIARDLGRICESHAHCHALRRTGIGPFCVKDSQENGISPRQYFEKLNVPVCTVDSVVASLLLKGTPVKLIPDFILPNDGLFLVVDQQEHEIAVIEKNERDIKYRIVFDSVTCS